MKTYLICSLKVRGSSHVAAARPSETNMAPLGSEVTGSHLSSDSETYLCGSLEDETNPHEVLTLRVPWTGFRPARIQKRHARDLSASAVDQYSPEGARRSPISPWVHVTHRLLVHQWLIILWNRIWKALFLWRSRTQIRFKSIAAVTCRHVGKNIQLIEVYLPLFLKHRWFDTENWAFCFS